MQFHFLTPAQDGETDLPGLSWLERMYVLRIMELIFLLTLRALPMLISNAMGATKIKWTTDRLGACKEMPFLKSFSRKCFKNAVPQYLLPTPKKYPNLVRQTISTAETSSSYRLSRELTIGMSLSNRPTKQNVVHSEPLL